MPNFFPIRVVQVVERIVAAAGGQVNALGKIASATSPRVLLTVRPFRVATTTAVKRAVIRVVSRTDTAGDVLVTVSALVRARTNATFAARVLGRLAPIPTATDTALLQIDYDWSRTIPAASVAQVAAGGRSDWANPGNAAGPPNAVNATIAGNALAARGGRLNMTMQTVNGKDVLTLTAATLTFHITQAGTVLDNGDVQVGYRDQSNVDRVLATFAGDVTTPQTFDIFGMPDVDVPSDLGLIRPYVTFVSAALETQTATCDAVTVAATAHWRPTDAT